MFIQIRVGHNNNCQIILKYDIVCNNLQYKKFQANLEVSEAFITDVTNRGKVWVMFIQIGAGHNNNCQIILKLFGCDIFCNNVQQKQFQANLAVSEVLICNE